MQINSSLYSLLVSADLGQILTFCICLNLQAKSSLANAFDLALSLEISRLSLEVDSIDPCSEQIK